MWKINADTAKIAAIRSQALPLIQALASAEMNEALFAPSLVHTSDWYLFSSLERYKKGVRGSNPLDQTGIMMRPMAMTLADEQAIKDVVAYVTQLAGAP